MPSPRQKRRATQDIDAEASFSVAEEGTEQGYYIGLVGALLKYLMGTIAAILLVATQTVPESFFFILMIVTFYITGWIMSREAGFETIAAYELVPNAIAWGGFFGFVVRIVEGLVMRMTSELEDIQILAPFEPFLNAQNLAINGLVLTTMALIFASVSEELLHRGGMVYLAEVLEDRRGMDPDVAKAVSLLTQAATFAFSHAAVYHSWSQIWALFAGGIVFGLIVYWKKDLSIAIIAHLTVNLSAVVPYAIAYLLQNPMLALGLVIAGVVLLVLFSYRGGDEDYE